MYRTLEFPRPVRFHFLIWSSQSSRWLRQGWLLNFKDEKTEVRMASLDVAELRPESTFLDCCQLTTVYSVINWDNTRHSIKWWPFLFLLSPSPSSPPPLLRFSILIAVDKCIFWDNEYLFMNEPSWFPCARTPERGGVTPKAQNHPYCISFLLSPPSVLSSLPSFSHSLVHYINIYFKLSFPRFTGDSAIALADGLRGQLS